MNGPAFRGVRQRLQTAPQRGLAGEDESCRSTCLPNNPTRFHSVPKQDVALLVDWFVFGQTKPDTGIGLVDDQCPQAGKAISTNHNHIDVVTTAR